MTNDSPAPSGRTRRVGDASVPTFLYGTAWKEDATAGLVTMALEAGFRGIDTANQRRHYHEAGVGEALREAFGSGLVSRDEVFLQTKYTPVGGQDHRLPYDPHAPHGERVRQSFESSLEHLGVERLDSYVLHGPSTPVGLDPADLEVWEAMEELHEAGRTRLLGVSNVSRDQLVELCERARVPPAFVQNRCFARTGWDAAVRAACRERDIVYQGFSLLTANPEVTSHMEVRAIAERHRCTPEQVVFRFAMQVGMLPLTGTTSPEHARQDLAAHELELTSEEVGLVEAISVRG